jgi:kynurenine formamidase
MKNFSTITILIVLGIIIAPVIQAQEKSLWSVATSLKSKTHVDLTHTFDKFIPHVWIFEPEERTLFMHLEPGLGSFGRPGSVIHRYNMVGQWGTHVDPPGHFVEGKEWLDEIGVDNMIMPLVVLDIHEQAAANNDYEITMDVVKDWEKRHGNIPQGAFVALRSDWSKRWSDSKSFINTGEDGINHVPTWSIPVLDYLYNTRKISASGQETLDADQTVSAATRKQSLEYFILSHARFQIDQMTNLDQVPEYGAIISATWAKPRNGSGFPARVYAILP